MRARLRTAYHTLAGSDTALGTTLWRLRHGHPLNTVRQHVRGSGNHVRYDGALLHDVDIDIVGNGNSVTVERRCILHGVRIHLRGDGHTLRIGSRSTFSEGGDLWMEDGGGTLEIGPDSTFVSAQLAVTEPGSSIRIGADCLFAYDIEVRTGDSHAILDAATGERLNPAADVRVGEHVWVTAGCRLLKGSRVADGSVVGANSVVTHAFDEPGVVIAGDPARVIRHGVVWLRERDGAVSGTPHA